MHLIKIIKCRIYKKIVIFINLIKNFLHIINNLIIGLKIIFFGNLELLKLLGYDLELD